MIAELLVVELRLVTDRQTRTDKHRAIAYTVPGSLLTFNVSQKTPITDMAPDIMADMVNADCVHIRWLDALCSGVTMGSARWAKSGGT